MTTLTSIFLITLGIFEVIVAGRIGTDAIPDSLASESAMEPMKVYIQPLQQESAQVQSIHYGDSQVSGSHDQSAHAKRPEKKHKGSLLSHHNIVNLLIEIFGAAIIPIFLLPLFGLGFLYLLWSSRRHPGYFNNYNSQPYAFDNGGTYGRGDHSQVIGYDYSQIQKKVGLEKKKDELTARIIPHLKS